MTTDEEAQTILADTMHQAGTLFGALDTDGDGYLREVDFGGPTEIYGAVRRSNILRMLDNDGDMVISPDDIAAASERILILDHDGDGQVTAADDIPPPSANMENTMPMGSPAQRLEFQKKMQQRDTCRAATRLARSRLLPCASGE